MKMKKELFKTISSYQVLIFFWLILIFLQNLNGLCIIFPCNTVFISRPWPALISQLPLLWARAWTRDLLTSLPNWISLQSYDLCKFHSFSFFEPPYACRLHLCQWIPQFTGLSPAAKARRSVHHRAQGRPPAPPLQLKADNLCLCHVLHSFVWAEEGSFSPKYLKSEGYTVVPQGELPLLDSTPPRVQRAGHRSWRAEGTRPGATLAVHPPASLWEWNLHSSIQEKCQSWRRAAVGPWSEVNVGMRLEPAGHSTSLVLPLHYLQPL